MTPSNCNVNVSKPPFHPIWPASPSRAHDGGMTPNPKRLKIAVLDDHPITVFGLAACLNQDAGLEVVLAETSAQQFLQALSRQPCDMVIVDYDLPDADYDGMSLIRRLRRHDRRRPIVTLSAAPARDVAYPAFRAGARGYLSKSDPTHLISELIRAVYRQPRQFHLNIGGKICSAMPQAPADLLSASETEILRHIALGLSVTQAAERLSRSKKTVSTHKRRAMRKLGLADDLALALYLKRHFETRLP